MWATGFSVVTVVCYPQCTKLIIIEIIIITIIFIVIIIAVKLADFNIVTMYQSTVSVCSSLLHDQITGLRFQNKSDT